VRERLKAGAPGAASATPRAAADSARIFRRRRHTSGTVPNAAKRHPRSGRRIP